MKKILTLVLGSVLLYATACNNSDEQDPGTPPANPPVLTDSLADAEPDSVLTGEAITFFNQSDVGNYARTKTPQFDWKQFTLKQSWEDDSLLVQPFKPAPRFFSNYGKLLKYSPDSTRFVDLDSYNIDLQKDKSGKWTAVEQGPDSEVSLVNLKDSTRKRIFFFGPGSSVEDAVWVDDHTVYLVGVYSSGEDSVEKVPVVWKYDTRNNSFLMYESSNQALVPEIQQFSREVRWKGIQVK